MRFVQILLLGCALAAAQTWAASQIDVYQFDNDEQRARYKALIEELRCPKCMNTNLAGSDAPIAQDLRRTVHRLVVVEGYSNQAVRDHLQARYGDFVLYRPPFTAQTALVWTVPVGLGLLGLAVLLAMRWRVGADTTELTAEQRAQIDASLALDKATQSPSDGRSG